MAGRRAQQPAMPVIGFLRSSGAAGFAHLVTAFRRGLAEAGFVEGQNIAIEYRFAENHHDRVPALTTDLIRRHVAVIVANMVAAKVAKSVTATTPIVFVTGSDPVKFGLVESLNRPGGNLTGVSSPPPICSPNGLNRTIAGRESGGSCPRSRNRSHGGEQGKRI